MLLESTGVCPSGKLPTESGWIDSVNCTRRLVAGSTPESPLPGTMIGALIGGGLDATSGRNVSGPTVAPTPQGWGRYCPTALRTEVVIVMRISRADANASYVESWPSASGTNTNVPSSTRPTSPGNDVPGIVPGKPRPSGTPS